MWKGKSIWDLKVPTNCPWVGVAFLIAEAKLYGIPFTSLVMVTIPFSSLILGCLVGGWLIFMVRGQFMTWASGVILRSGLSSVRVLGVSLMLPLISLELSLIWSSLHVLQMLILMMTLYGQPLNLVLSALIQHYLKINRSFLLHGKIWFGSKVIFRSMPFAYGWTFKRA